MAISTVLTQVQVLFILLGIGYYFSARHIVTDTGIQQLTALLCFLIMPCVLFSAFEITFRQDIFHNLLLTAMAAVFTHALPVFFIPIYFLPEADSGCRSARGAAIQCFLLQLWLYGTSPAYGHRWF